MSLNPAEQGRSSERPDDNRSSPTNRQEPREGDSASPDPDEESGRRQHAEADELATDPSHDGPHIPNLDDVRPGLTEFGDLRRRNLLMISYYYPPMGLSGVVRTAKFSRYLPYFGWDPIVLTVGGVAYYAEDNSLLREVLESGVHIERTNTLDPLRMLRRKGTLKMPSARRRRAMIALSHSLLQPDNKIGWKRYAIRRALEVAERERIDAIYATAPPFTSFLIARELQKELDVPLIIDYRDPWMDNPEYTFVTPLHRRYSASIEEDVLKNADGIVVVNRRIKELLLERYRFLDHESVMILTSGYDASDFRIAEETPLEKPERMRITFSGVADIHQKPVAFFPGIAKFFERRPDAREDIELCFVGHLHDRLRKLAAQEGVEENISAPGYVEHLEAIRYLLSSDLLWLASQSPSIVPGKLHEYIGSRKPILALAPEGVIHATMQAYGAGTAVDPYDVEAIADALGHFYDLWKSGDLPTGNSEVADEYEQQVVTERLSRVLAYSLRI